MPEPVPDILFQRGSHFSYLFKIPEELPENYFDTWKAEARIRKRGSNLPFDQIDLAQVYHYKREENRILFYAKDTAHWPLGEAELFVRFISLDDYKIAAKPVGFVISDGGFA